MSESSAEPVATFANVAELYATSARRLEQIVRIDVRAPDPVIEDACQFAWSRLLHRCQYVRRESALAWLATVAVHEAFKLIRREDRELSLDAALEAAAEPPSRAWSAGPTELAEQRERLRALGVLPERQQRLLWLQAVGLSYDEMALYANCTSRTVERQLLNARAKLRVTEAAGK